MHTRTRHVQLSTDANMPRKPGLPGLGESTHSDCRDLRMAATMPTEARARPSQHRSETMRNCEARFDEEWPRNKQRPTPRKMTKTKGNRPAAHIDRATYCNFRTQAAENWLVMLDLLSKEAGLRAYTFLRLSDVGGPQLVCFCSP